MRALRRALAVLSVVPVIAGLAACSTSGSGNALGGASGGASVVAAHPTPADQLDFFDALEARDRVTYDDAIHAALLLEQEDSQTDYAKRVAVARQNGLLQGDFDRAANRSITTGEAADLIMRAMVSRGGGKNLGESTPAVATAEFQSSGVLAESAAPSDLISGRDFVAMLTGARELIGLAPAREPTTLAQAQKAAMPTKAGAASPGESFDEPEGAQAATDDGATRALTSLPAPQPAGEPLVAPGATAPAPAPSPTPTPAPAPVAAKPEPEKPKATPPAKDKQWVPGRPVKAPPSTPPTPKSGG